jgi:uncharacterized protein
MYPNEELARRELQVLKSGDTEQLGSLYADEFVLHYPGRNPLAGEHRSLEGFLRRFQPLFGEDGTVTRELHDALGTDDHAVQLLTVTANARGKMHRWHAAVIMHTGTARSPKCGSTWRTSTPSIGP